MMWAAMNGRFRAAEYLLERGADIETKDMVSDTIIHLKLQIRYTWLYVRIYQFGCTALMNTVRQHNQLQMVEYLVQKGADMETTDHVSGVTVRYQSIHDFFCECLRMEPLH